tara:strand:+ start:41305 stop:41712 length:408 start_codon:yes stop_codon:yes gene_type:complete
MQNLILHHVSILARDVARSVAFYRDVIGLELLKRPNFAFDGAWFACGDRQIHIIDHPPGTHRSNPAVDIADAHFAFRTDDMDAVLADLTRLGYSETAEEGDPKRMVLLRDSPTGFIQVYLNDPDLNVVEINNAPM